MWINVLPAFEKIHCILRRRVCFIGEIVLVHSSKLFQCIASKTERLFTFMRSRPFLLTLANGAVSVCIQARNITLKQQVKYDLRYLAQGAKERSRAFHRRQVIQFKTVPKSERISWEGSATEWGRLGAAIKQEELEHVPVAKDAKYRYAKPFSCVVPAADYDMNIWSKPVQSLLKGVFDHRIPLSLEQSHPFAPFYYRFWGWLV